MTAWIQGDAGFGHDPNRVLTQGDVFGQDHAAGQVIPHNDVLTAFPTFNHHFHLFG